MRGADSYNESLFTTVKLEDFVPANRHGLVVNVEASTADGTADRDVAA